jgi:hypothetical protein
MGGSRGCSKTNCSREKTVVVHESRARKARTNEMIKCVEMRKESDLQIKNCGIQHALMTSRRTFGVGAASDAGVLTQKQKPKKATKGLRAGFGTR